MSRKSSALLACKNCHMIVDPSAAFCPNCRSTELSDDWSGLVVIFDVEGSKIAKLLSLVNPGRYALKVR